MLDLNLGSTISAHNHKESAMEDDHREPSGTNTELSGTSSTSSVVNVDESPASVELDFFRRDYSSRVIVTRQLFPMIGDDRECGGGESEMEVTGFGLCQKMSCNNQQWLNLSVSGSGSGFEAEAPPPGTKQQIKRSRRGPRSRSSQYRGVTFYRRTGRWESHIWDCGKQVYLGGFDTAHAAARAYDRAAIKFRGVDADINFTISDYEEDMKQTKNLNKEEFVQILRRHSNGFARGSSRYRGVTLHKCGRWEARMGQLLGKKAYDKAALQCNGREAVTNFEPSTYEPNNNGGGEHNLDLNLGISISRNGPKESNNSGFGESSTPHSHIPLANGKWPLSGSCGYYSANPGMTMTPLPMASKQSSSSAIWSSSSLPPPTSATFQENGAKEGMSMESFSGRVISNTQVQQLMSSNTISSAASSGFSSSSSANYNYTLPFTNPNHNFFITANSSSFHPYTQNK